jgi:hypothetical protein
MKGNPPAITPSRFAKMKPQTEDNLRCLGATIVGIMILVGLLVDQPAWLEALPGWIQFLIVGIPLLATYRLFNYRRNASPDRVSFDDSAITRTLPDGKTESVRWDDLQEVGIVTTDEGPMVEDVYWMLLGSNGGCAVPGGALGAKELLNRLQQLPGFNNEAVIEAMGSTSNGSFVCWKRQALDGLTKT